MTTASYPGPSDAELVAMWQRGDEGAATELVRRHAAPIGRYLAARGATSAERDDLLQETFFRAFRGIAGWRAEGSLRGWLFRIAANLLKDRYRHDGGRVFVEILDDDLVGRADPASELAATETAVRLQEGLANLSPMQREVFLLRVEQGLDYKEVAVVLATTEGAARVHYHHAVKRLRERLL
jgi:RNA polymerase sigma-70 factor (ECF subfamily)